ncbi:MAG: type II toxin-antitoxin system PemK/MazF family toxin [Ruminococcus flavefaciens]|nr:type II toxin-antitoxin system PemK/MazF family toxin [Ruminococcus flavefaciens]
MKNSVIIENMMNDENFPYRRGNIVWIKVPEVLKGVTHIQAGLRKGLIFSNDVNNLFSDLIYIIPCTTKSKFMKFHVRYENQYILAEQLNPIDKSWILSDREIIKIDDETMKKVERNFLQQFGFSSLTA